MLMTLSAYLMMLLSILDDQRNDIEKVLLIL